MTRRLDVRRLFLALPLAIFVFSYIFSRYFEHSPELVNALTLDFVITAPICYYIIIRKQRIPNFTALPLAFLALFVASVIFPSPHQALISKLQVILLPLIELYISIQIVRKILEIFKNYQKIGTHTPDFYDALVEATEGSLPRSIGKIIATEIAVLYFLFHPKGAKDICNMQYSYHRESGTSLVLSTFVGIILIETFALHIILASLNTTIAWILTGLSIYTCLQVIALMRSLGKRPIIIDDDERKIYLRYGFFTSAVLNINEISKIQVTARTLNETENMQKLSPFGAIDNHNLIFHLDKNCTVQNIYGKDKNCSKLALFVDQRDSFIKQIMKIQNRQ